MTSEAPDQAGTLSPAASFITTLRWQDLPDPVIRRAVMCLVDTVAAMLAGRPAESTRIAADLATAWWGAGDAHLIHDGRRLKAQGAAFANAVAANAVDIDDCGIYTWGHPGAQVVPTALALAEEQDLDGQGLLTAIVVGYEIAFRAGRCVNYEASKIAAAERTYRACASWGSVACAAIASHILGLTEAKTRHALGIAEYHSPDVPMMRDLQTPAMVKHGVGAGAVTGLMAADLASRGFTGITPSLDTEAFRGFADDLGIRYLLPQGITWKRFSSCAWTHPALLAVEAIIARAKVEPDAIEAIVIEVYPDAARLGTRLPATTEQAQFNLAWPVAALLVDGRVGPEQVLEGRLSDKLIRSLAERVEVRVTDELTRLYYLSEANDPEGKDAAVVTITLRDGTRLSSGLTENVLYPQPGWATAEMAAKFRWLAAGNLTASAIDDVLERLLDIAAVQDASAFMRDLTSSLLSAELLQGVRSMDGSTKERSPSRRMLGGALVAGVLVLGALAGCSSSGSGATAPSSNPTAPSSSPTADASASAGSGGGAVTADPALTAMLPASIKSAGVLRVASNIPFPPWEMYTKAGGNQPTGIDYDLSQALAAKLGIKATFDQTAFDSIIPSILAGKEDVVMAGIFDTPVREKALDFVDYAHDGFALLVKKGNPEGIKSVDDLAGKSVSVQSSTSAATALATLSHKFQSEGKKPINILGFPNDSDALLAVPAGRADARLDAISAGAYAVKTFGSGNAFDMVQSPTVAAQFGTGMQGLGVPKNNPQLLHALQKAMQALIDDGAYTKILDKYGASVLGIATAGINEGAK